MCLSVREDISGTTRAICTKFVHVAYKRGSVAVQRRCDTLSTSGFMDDITYLFYNGPYNDTNFATKDRFLLNLLIYHKTGQFNFLLLKGIILANYF